MAATSMLGFEGDLFMMPLDHRRSFAEDLLGIRDREPTSEEIREIRRYKAIVYDGFKKAIAAGVPKDKVGILVDERFGAEILDDAHAFGFITACRAELDSHLDRFHPTFVKASVISHHHGPRDRLHRLSAYCHSHGIKLMLELTQTGGDPRLVADTMAAIQDAGIEADVWKVEGIESEAGCRKIVAQAKAGGRSHVGVLILGRGESAEKVKDWLQTAARVPGLAGFAVGRTIFWESLKAVKEGRLTRDQASDAVAANYKEFCDFWLQARGVKA